MAGYYHNAKDPSTKNGDCVTNEPCQETNPSINLERLCTKKGLNIGGAEHVQTCTAERNTDSRLSEIRHDKQKSPQDFQTEKYCVTKNLNSLHSGLQNCTKEVRKTKAAAVSCERNIWAVLRGDGNFWYYIVIERFRELFQIISCRSNRITLGYGANFWLKIRHTKETMISTYIYFNHKIFNFPDCDWFKNSHFRHQFTCQVVIGQFIIEQFSKPITFKVVF